MRINFFCEYPDEDLEKAELVPFESTVYIAARSLEDYREYRNELKNLNSDLEAAYWPIMEGSYWISPFTCRRELERLFEETKMLDDEVLLDLELPILSPSEFLKGIYGFSDKKALIRSIIGSERTKISSNEYPIFPVLNPVSSWLGTRYRQENYMTYYMHFTSWLPDFLNSRIISYLKKAAEDSSHIAVNLGTITYGVLKLEPVLSPSSTKKDLEKIRDAGINKVSILRLGGLNQEYVDVLTEFSGDNN
jgi:hypothetical protein